MDIRREKQIIAAIAKEFQNQNNTLKIPVPADEVEHTAVDLADSLSIPDATEKQPSSADGKYA